MRLKGPNSNWKVFLKVSQALTLSLAVSCGSSGAGGQTDGVDELDHRIFLTSQTYNGSLGGAAGADQICQSAASSAGLVRAYKAILSVDDEQARHRLSVVGAVYTFDTGGVSRQVAEVGSDLWGSLLQSPVDRDEFGNQKATLVWTGTDSEGGNAAATLDNCANWTSSSSGVDGAVGDNLQTDGYWLEEINPSSCDNDLSIYCISQ